MMPEEKKIQQLNCLVREGAGPEKQSFLCCCLIDSDYAVRSKAFFAAEKICDEKTASFLCGIFENCDVHWQLRILSVFCCRPYEIVLPYLRSALFQREKPLLIRGSLLALVHQPFRGINEIFDSFMQSPYSGYLKEDFIFHCKEKIAEWNGVGGETIDSPDDSAIPGKKNELLMVYPYPGYLQEMAAKEGIEPAEWKRICYFPRRKKSK